MNFDDHTPKPDSISRWTVVDPREGPVVSRNVRFDEIKLFARNYLSIHDVPYVTIKAQYYFEDTRIERS